MTHSSGDTCSCLCKDQTVGTNQDWVTWWSAASRGRRLHEEHEDMRLDVVWKNSTFYSEKRKLSAQISDLFSCFIKKQ